MAILGVGLAGCAAPDSGQTRPSPRPLGREFPTYQAPTQVSDQTEMTFPVGGPVGKLTLREAVTLALKHNPELAGFSWEIRTREALAYQASLWPNPELEIEGEGLGKSSGSSRYEDASVGIGQLFLTAGKLAKRTRVAELQSDLAAWDYETARLRVLTQVATAYVSVLAAQEQVALAQDSTDLAERVFDVISEQVEEGKTSPVERTRTRVVLSLSRVDLDRARRGLEAAKEQLAATWGGTTATFEEVLGELDRVETFPPLSSLVEVVSENPQIARWAVELEERRADLSLAKARAYPDFKLGGALERLAESDETAAIASISLPLPLFNRNQGGIDAARSGLAQAQIQRRDTEVRVRAALNTTYRGLQAAYTEATTIRDETLPDAEQVFEAVQTGYQTGKFDLLDVLDAERTLFNIREQYVEGLARYHQRRAELEGWIGRPLEQVQNSSTNHSNNSEVKP